MSNTLSRRHLLGTGLVATAALATTGRAARSAPLSVDDGTGVTALTHVTVVDVVRGTHRPDRTVLLRGDRILTVGRSADVGVPPRARVLDLTGKFLIPGLWDMHAHSQGLERIDLPLSVVNGITGVREMSGGAYLFDWRARTEAGTLLGPRSVIGSPILDGFPSLWAGLPVPHTEARDAAQARDAVRAAQRTGADFVKVYSRLTPAQYDAVRQEARRLRIPFAGHLPDGVAPAVVSRAGQRSIEHLFSVWFATSPRENELRRSAAALRLSATGPLNYRTWFRGMEPLEWAAARGYRPALGRRLFDRLAADGTRLTPTLVMHRALDHGDEVAHTVDPNTQYLPKAVRDGLRHQLDQLYLAGRTPAEIARRPRLFTDRLAWLADAARAGVPILAGTDSGTPGLVGGFALHEELALLVRAGLSPAEALRAATLEPARFLGLAGTMGSVEPGKCADLVVLDADPLADIRATTTISGVVLRGRVITAEERNRMLAALAAEAARTP